MKPTERVKEYFTTSQEEIRILEKPKYFKLKPIEYLGFLYSLED